MNVQVRRRSPEGWLICRAFSENGEQLRGCLQIRGRCCGCRGCCAHAYSAGSKGLSVGQSYTWLVQDEDVFGTEVDEGFSEKSGSSVRSDNGGGGVSGSLKKRFSIFSNDASARNDAATQEDGVGREGSGGSSSERWFDIAMNFCSEMDLPVREDIDDDIVKEAKSMMKEEGRL